MRCAALALLGLLGCGEAAAETASTPPPPRVPTPVSVTPAMFAPFEPYPNAQYLCQVHDLGDIGESVTITLSTTDDLGTVRAFYEAHHGALQFVSMQAGFAVRSRVGPMQDLVGVDPMSIPRVCGQPSTGRGTVLLLTTHFGL